MLEKIPFNTILIVYIVVSISILILSWIVYKYTSVTIKTISGFLFFSLLLLISVATTSSYLIIDARREWVSYEKDRLKEAMFVFLEKLKRNNEAILAKYSRMGSDLEKMSYEQNIKGIQSIFLNDRYLTSTFDIFGVMKENGDILFSAVNLNTNGLRSVALRISTTSIVGKLPDFYHTYLRLENTVFLISAVPFTDTEGKVISQKSIFVGVNLERHAIPALQDMLKVEDSQILFERSSEEGVSEIPLESIEGIPVAFLSAKPKEEDIFIILRRVSRTTLISFLSLLLFSALFYGILTSLYVKKPVDVLRRVVPRVGEGKFDFRLPEIYSGDIGQLIRTFNIMLSDLEQTSRDISYRNSLLYSLSLLGERILGEYDRESIFQICVKMVNWALENSQGFILTPDSKVRGTEPFQILPELENKIRTEENFEHGGRYYVSIRLVGFKGEEEKPLDFGFLVVSKNTPFIKVESEFLTSLASQVSSACQRTDFITKLKLLQSQDTLTGIFNKRFVFDALKKEYSRASRFGAPFCIVLFDIKNFTQVNSKYGYLVGDDILKGFASSLKRAVRTYDLPARVGPDEFCLVLPNTTAENADIVASRIVSSFKSSPEVPQITDIEIDIYWARVSFDEARSAEEMVEKAYDKIRSL